jgi:hypothetical protein
MGVKQKGKARDNEKKAYHRRFMLLLHAKGQCRWISARFGNAQWRGADEKHPVSLVADALSRPWVATVQELVRRTVGIVRCEVETKLSG